MSRKDYVKLANVIADAYSRNKPYKDIDRFVDQLVTELCNILKEGNDKFDASKFLNHINKRIKV